MLAYYFYHWNQPNVTATAYEERLTAFHAALAATPPQGFSRSWSHALTGSPWANGGGPSYEDWYIVDTSADLDPLNEAAVSASRKVPHDRVAAGTANGSAGLYRVRLGTMIGQPRFIAWFSKPDGWSYAQLYDQLTPTITPGAALWQRQMALGPGEFCLHSRDAAAFPSGIRAQSVAVRAVFPRGV